MADITDSQGLDVLQILVLKKRVLEVSSSLSLFMTETKPYRFKRNGAAVVPSFSSPTISPFVTCWDETIHNTVNKCIPWMPKALISLSYYKALVSPVLSPSAVPDISRKACRERTSGTQGNK